MVSVWLCKHAKRKCWRCWIIRLRAGSGASVSVLSMSSAAFRSLPIPSNVMYAGIGANLITSSLLLTWELGRSGHEKCSPLFVKVVDHCLMVITSICSFFLVAVSKTNG